MANIPNDVPNIINKFKTIINTAAASMKTEPLPLDPNGDSLKNALAEFDILVTQIKEMQDQQAKLLIELKTRVISLHSQLNAASEASAEKVNQSVSTATEETNKTNATTDGDQSHG